MNKQFVSYKIFKGSFELFYIWIVMKATFTSDDAKQVFNIILILSTSQNKLKFLLFL